MNKNLFECALGCHNWEYFLGDIISSKTCKVCGECHCMFDLEIATIQISDGQFMQVVRERKLIIE